MGGSYDEGTFYRDRKGEELVLSVGRIHPDKNQLELVAGYRERIWERYGLPLHLVGGVTDPAYFAAVEPYIDGVSVVASLDREQPQGAASWRSAREIAELCNRARLFVTASPRESFGIALLEALACGTTCVVNGEFRGFAESELAPRVFGHVAGKRGSTLDLIDQALAGEARIDASAWARKYSLGEIRKATLRFIRDRLG